MATYLKRISLFFLFFNHLYCIDNNKLDFYFLSGALNKESVNFLFSSFNNKVIGYYYFTTNTAKKFKLTGSLIQNNFHLLEYSNYDNNISATIRITISNNYFYSQWLSYDNKKSNNLILTNNIKNYKFLNDYDGTYSLLFGDSSLFIMNINSNFYYFAGNAFYDNTSYNFTTNIYITNNYIDLKITNNLFLKILFISNGLIIYENNTNTNKIYEGIYIKE